MLNTIKDRLLQIRLQKDEKRVKLAFIAMASIIVFLLLNIIYLNLTVVKTRIAATTSKMDESSPAASPTLILSPTPTPSPPPKTTTDSTSGSNTIAVKDYFIPLGSGTSQAGDWTDVPGVQAIVDFGQYPHIKEVFFEASVYIPTANQSVSVRLFNVTDKHPVWNSEVTTANATAYLTSPPLNYDLGAKVYQVQMKTQLQYTANLVQSRIHIVLE